ncbi:hypothetical protein U1Q18_051205 [Sarracenia purpurea var. burkii]
MENFMARKKAKKNTADGEKNGAKIVPNRGVADEKKEPLACTEVYLAKAYNFADTDADSNGGAEAGEKKRREITPS